MAKTLDDSLRAEIEADIRQTQSAIHALIKGEFRNTVVSDNDYLSPSTMGHRVPFGEEGGMFHYFCVIQDGLNEALRTGSIPGEYQPYFVRAPKNIRGLLEEDDPEQLG